MSVGAVGARRTSGGARAAVLCAGFGAILLACACSEDAPSGTTGGADGAPHAAEPFAPRADATLADASTALVIAVDRLRPADLDLPGLVHLRRLVASSHRFELALASSTAGNAALASVLTGLEPPAHGVRSVHDVGRTRLADEHETLPEALAAAGWTSLASVGARREARGIAGFEQGFSRFEDPRGAALAVRADVVVQGFEDAARGALDGEADVFALLTFAELSREIDVDAADPRLPAVVRRRLEPHARTDRDLAQLLDDLDGDTEAAWAALAKRYGRMREASAAIAWRAARRELELLAVDDAVGRVLAILENSGRAEDALIAVLGTRGDVVGPGRRSAPRIPREALEVPLLVRMPGSVGAGSVPGAAETRGLRAWLVRALTGARDAAPADLVGEGSARGFAASGSVVSVREPGGAAYEVDADGLRTEVRGGQLVQARAGEAPPPDPAARELLTALRLAASAPVEVRWKLADGRAFDEAERRFRPAAIGALELGGDAPAAGALRLLDRTAAVRIEVAAADVGPADIALDGDAPASAADAPVQWVPVDESSKEPVPADEGSAPAGAEVDPAAHVVLSHEAGKRWTLEVPGDGPAEVLVSVWPPRAPRERVEVLLGAGVRQLDVPGRRDLVHLVGERPFDAVLEKVGAEEFSVTCWTPGGFVEPARIEIDGRRYARSDRLAFVAPSWQPSVSERIPDGLAAVARASTRAASPLEVPGWARVALRREERGPLPRAGSAVPSELRRLLNRLSRGE